MDGWACGFVGLGLFFVVMYCVDVVLYGVYDGACYNKSQLPLYQNDVVITRLCFRKHGDVDV